MAPLRNPTFDAHWAGVDIMRNPSRVHPMVPVVMVGNTNSSIIRLNAMRASGLHDEECSAGVVPLRA